MMACDVGLNNQYVRERWLEETLLALPGGARILDAGAGELKYKRFCKHLDYVSQDFGQYDGVGDSTGLQEGGWDQSRLDIVSDITTIPEANSSFDAIMCVEVLEHLPDPNLAIQEFSRLLRTGGALIITAPFCSLTHFAPFHFFSGLNSYFYEKHLHNNSFEILEITPNGNFFEFLAQELRRLPSVADKYASTRPTRIERMAMKLVLKMLQRLSGRDAGSAELLNFGYQVLAKKI